MTMHDTERPSSAWVQAVDSLTDYIEWVRSDDGRRLHAGFAHSCMKVDLAKSGFITPGEAETDRDTLRRIVYQRAMATLAVQPFDGHALYARGLATFTDELWDTVCKAAPVYITEEMCATVDWVEPVVPGDVDVTPQMLVEPSLWLYLAEPLLIQDAQGGHLVVRALLVSSAAHEDPNTPGLDYVVMTDPWDERDDTESGALIRETAEARMRGLLMPVAVGGISFGSHKRWPDDDTIARAVEGDVRERPLTIVNPSALGTEITMSAVFDARRMERWIVAALALMNERMTTVSRFHAPRANTRRLQRAQRRPDPFEPRVVMLRRAEHIVPRAPGESARNWTHRWWVRPHWRRKPNGAPGYVFVHGYIKGPEHAEFIPRDNAYVWGR